MIAQVMWSSGQEGELGKEKYELWTMKPWVAKTCEAELILSVGTPSTYFGGVVDY